MAQSAEGQSKIDAAVAALESQESEMVAKGLDPRKAQLVDSQAPAQDQDIEASPGHAPHDSKYQECPRCGFDVNAGKALKPSAEDLEEYIRGILGGTPFTKQYAVFQGRATVKISGLTSTESSQLSNILRTIESDDPVTVGTQALRYRLVCQIRQTNERKHTLPEDLGKYTIDMLEQEFSERFGNLPEDLVAIYVNTLLMFQNLMGVLAESAFDEDFYKGAGLG